VEEGTEKMERARIYKITKSVIHSQNSPYMKNQAYNVVIIAVFTEDPDARSQFLLQVFSLLFDTFEFRRSDQIHELGIVVEEGFRVGLRASASREGGDGGIRGRRGGHFSSCGDSNRRGVK